MSNSNLEVSKANRANEMSELKDLTKFRLDEINKIKDYLNAEIKERKDIIKKISKYIVAFDYADKLFITLSASFGTLSIASHATVVGIPVGIVGASLPLIFTVTTGVIKKLSNITTKKKNQHNKIIALARSKLNIIENLISQALIDFEITNEEFSKIIKFIKQQQAKGINPKFLSNLGLKQQQAKEFLSNLGLRTPLNKIPVLGDISF